MRLHFKDLDTPHTRIHLARIAIGLAIEMYGDDRRLAKVLAEVAIRLVAAPYVELDDDDMRWAMNKISSNVNRLNDDFTVNQLRWRYYKQHGKLIVDDESQTIIWMAYHYTVGPEPEKGNAIE